jgi:hypothetical protein
MVDSVDFRQQLMVSSIYLPTKEVALLHSVLSPRQGVTTLNRSAAHVRMTGLRLTV